ncbi:hypothetical protein ACFYSC_32440 [Streptosporangium sp. NPDC004379]|uniref:hypothetical protein n=1 Tax=Streptosporangium sp. NPDC004379 TaxID=3366189 RepID=UPI0036CD0250
MTDEPGTPAQGPQCAGTGCDVPADQHAAHPQWDGQRSHPHDGDDHEDDGHGGDACPCHHDD